MAAVGVTHWRGFPLVIAPPLSVATAISVLIGVAPNSAVGAARADIQRLSGSISVIGHPRDLIAPQLVGAAGSVYAANVGSIETSPVWRVTRAGRFIKVGSIQGGDTLVGGGSLWRVHTALGTGVIRASQILPNPTPPRVLCSGGAQSVIALENAIAGVCGGKVWLLGASHPPTAIASAARGDRLARTASHLWLISARRAQVVWGAGRGSLVRLPKSLTTLDCRGANERVHCLSYRRGRSELYAVDFEMQMTPMAVKLDLPQHVLPTDIEGFRSGLLGVANSTRSSGPSILRFTPDRHVETIPLRTKPGHIELASGRSYACVAIANPSEGVAAKFFLFRDSDKRT
jgi:hypothetical protein